MNHVTKVLLLTTAVLLGPQSPAEPSCLPDFLSLQALERIDPYQERELVYRLHSERGSGRFATKVILKAVPDAKEAGVLRLSVLFDPDFDGVSLPYNLYAVEVIVDGQVKVWMDYTHGCRGPGLGFFNGSEIRLPAAKLVGDQPQTLQIMVWGRL